MKEGDDSESVYLGVSIKEKHIKYYIPEYTKYPCYIKPAEEEWDPNNGFFPKEWRIFHSSFKYLSNIAWRRLVKKSSYNKGC